MKTIFLLLFFSYSIYSQKIAAEQIDEFTKDKILQVNASKNDKWKASDNISRGIFNNVFLSLKSINSTKLLQLDIQTGVLICINNNEDKIILLLENEKTIELKQQSKLDCANRLLTKYIISDEEIKTLSNFKINKLRIYTYNGYINLEIKEDKKEIIKNTFNLFQSKI